MIILNTTFAMHECLVKSFTEFIRQIYLPAVLAEGILRAPRAMRVLSQQGDGIASLALQLEASDMTTLEAYLEARGAQDTELITTHWGDQVVGFTTLMERIDL